MTQPFPPSNPPDDCYLAVEIWQMSGRTIDYAALPVLCEMYGIEDVETLLVQLAAIRDFKWPNQSG